MGTWLSPPIVAAPSPLMRPVETHYRICEEFLGSNNAIRRRTPIFQIWAHVVGSLPPINAISQLERSRIKPSLCTLADSVACFRGVNRPYDEEENGDSVLVYVLNVDATVVFEPSMVCLARASRVPPDVALTVQVTETKPLQVGDMDVTGTITRIEFVFGDYGSPLLPSDHHSRYRERLW